MPDDQRKTRSPLKRRPLPTAGRSLDTQINDRIYEGVYTWAVVVAVGGCVAAWEWLGYAFNLPRYPWIVTSVGVATVALATWRAKRSVKMIRQLQQGRAGEVLVGQYLERLRVDGYQVFHDLPGDEKASWNVDHVLVGPGGIFAIETKTISKVEGAQNVVEYDGEYVKINDHVPNRDPIKQARGSAGRIREILEEETGRQVLVRPVVVFPNWFIRGTSAGKDVWVLEPKALPKWLANEPQRLSREDAALYGSRLARHTERTLERLYGQ